jgi:hypothetical protein
MLDSSGRKDLFGERGVHFFRVSRAVRRQRSPRRRKREFEIPSADGLRERRRIYLDGVDRQGRIEFE